MEELHAEVKKQQFKWKLAGEDIERVSLLVQIINLPCFNSSTKICTVDSGSEVKMEFPVHSEGSYSPVV